MENIYLIKLNLKNDKLYQDLNYHLRSIGAKPPHVLSYVPVWRLEIKDMNLNELSIYIQQVIPNENDFNIRQINSTILPLYSDDSPLDFTS